MDEKDSRGILLKEFLDAQHSSTDYDVVERAEAFFRKSGEEEQERMADFAESVTNIAQRPHHEDEDDPRELAPPTQAEAGVRIERNDALTESTADLDELICEADADGAETEDQVEEEVENAESTQ